VGGQNKDCITIIDTIILTNYTNNAYTNNTIILTNNSGGAKQGLYITCITIIDTIILTIYTNDAYIIIH
jgi:hypothetical protein